MTKEITLEELQAELDRLGVTSEAKGLTTAELCKLWGCRDGATRRRLKEAKALGVLRVGHKTIENLTGSSQRVVAYWFEFPAKTKQTKRGGK